MPLPDADKRSPRVYTLLQNQDLENLSASDLADVGDPIAIEEGNEDELRRLCLVGFARMVTKGSFDGWLSGGGGAETLGELTDVSMDMTNFVDSLLIQTNSDGAAPTTGTLSSADDNIGIGRSVFEVLESGNRNIGIGAKAFISLTSGKYNTGIGYGALNVMTTVNDNTALGYWAGGGIGNGGSNTAIGVNVMGTPGDGSQNTGVGSNALAKLAGGNTSVAVGYATLYNVTTAHGNTGLGKGAGYNVTGAKNLLIGYEAGETLTSGSNNLVMGAVDVDSATGDDQLVISSGDGGMFWIKGDSAGACYQGDNATTWSTTSDRVLKREITDATKGLDAINEIQIRNFRYRKDNPYGHDPETSRVGVIAQELEEVFPEAVEENARGHKTVSTDSINWALLKAVQELSAKVEALERAQ